TVRSFNRQHILDFIKSRYRTDQMVLASVGSISFKKVLKYAEKYFASVTNGGEEFNRQPFLHYQPDHREVKRNTHQVHYMLGAPAYAVDHDKIRCLVLLNDILGGPGITSRLNLSMHEKYDIVYNTESNYRPYTDPGLF